MPILKKYHHYVNKNKKSQWVAEVIPMEDIKVSQKMYDDYEDTTKKVAK